MSDLGAWAIFPFESPLRQKPVEPLQDADPVRAGDPGGPSCTACDRSDEGYAWTDARWRLRPVDGRHGFPVVLFLESRAHLDLGDLDDESAADLGRITVRLDRAIRSVDGVGRVHVHHWGDGLAHLHLWFFGRPLGAHQTVGAFSHVWDGLLPPTPPDVWERNLAAVCAVLDA